MIVLIAPCVLGLAVVVFVALGWLMERRPGLGGALMAGFAVVFICLVVTYAANVNLD
jgi:hypothetical protein